MLCVLTSAACRPTDDTTLATASKTLPETSQITTDLAYQCCRCRRRPVAAAAVAAGAAGSTPDVCCVASPHTSAVPLQLIYHGCCCYTACATIASAAAAAAAVYCPTYAVRCVSPTLAVLLQLIYC
jgi:hypothetical protein